MTVSATRDYEFTNNGIVTMAYRMAGLLNENVALTTAQATVARDLLEIVTKGLQADGFMTRAMAFVTLPLVAGTGTYSLASSDVVDVVGSAMHWVTAGDAEVTVSPLSREGYQALPNKASAGRPVLYYVHREGADPVLYLWPVPDANGFLRIQGHRLRAGARESNATPEFERYWYDYLVQELAYRIALVTAVPLNRVGFLKAGASEAFARAKGNSFQRTNQQMVLSHPTGWGRRF